MPTARLVSAALTVCTLWASACGGLDHFDRGELGASTTGSVAFAVSVEDPDGQPHGSELALALPGCALPCVRLDGQRAALPIACAPGGAAFALHDDGDRCRSPIGACRVEDDGVDAPTVRCVVEPASVQFVVELR